MKIGWGIDVGVGSLGFAVIELGAEGEPARLIDGVALVYPAPTGGAERTRYKSMRTQNRRRAKRMRRLRAELVRLFELDPGFDSENAHPDLCDGVGKNDKPRPNNSRVRLRAHGLSQRLSGGDLARAILHIAKNRGQRLTRGLKDDNSQPEKSAKERQSMADAANRTSNELAALGKTLELRGDDGTTENAHPSQLLMDRAGATGATRLKKDREGMPVFTRKMVKRELKALLTTQRCHHPAVLTEETCGKLKRMVFEEAESKPPAIGKCRYDERGADGEIESRLPRGSDLFQRKRIFEEVNNLRLICSRTAAERCLDLGQRNRLATILLDGQDLTASKVRKALNLKKDALADKTSLDISNTRKGRKTAGKLQGHPLAAAMAKGGALQQWNSLDGNERERLADLVRTEDDKEKLRAGLKVYRLSEEAIRALSDARLPTTYSAAGETATRRLLTALEAAVIPHHEAEKRAELKALDPVVPRLDRLPYYGEILTGWCVGGDGDPGGAAQTRFGRIPNPVVHVALNQIRKTANAYLDRYGKPARICVELARDMNKSAEERERQETNASKNRENNEKYVEQIQAHNRKIARRHLKMMKLHQMQGGECLYTGQTICMEMLFNDSVEIDHILPYAETKDNSLSNSALVLKDANGDKKKRTPYSAFIGGYKGQDYASILRRAEKRGKGVYWRFREDALDTWKQGDEFEERFLNDTRYVARMAVRYLSCVCDEANGVVSLNGRITADLRREWCLHTLIRDLMVKEGRLDTADARPPKDGETLEEIRERRKRMDKIRWDHRHHLLDAVVAACTTRSDVQRLHTLAAREDDGGKSGAEILAEIRRDDRDIGKAGICWHPGFRATVKAFLQGRGRGGRGTTAPITAVVRKPDHDRRGQLHEATNYGLICEVPGKRGQYVARDHVMIAELTAEKIEKLGIEDSVIWAVDQAMRNDKQFWWGGDDPLSALRDNLAKDLDNLRAELQTLMDTAPEYFLANARTEKGRKKAAARWATKQFTEKNNRHRYTRVQILSLRVLRGPLKSGKNPRQVNPTGGNDRLVYFINSKGDRDIEVVSTLDANTPGFRECWRREDGRPLFTLRKDDLVEMTVDPKDLASPRRMYRMVSFSGAGNPDLEFLPVEDARAPTEVSKQVRTRIRSVRAFRERNPDLVLCDPTGRVRWRSPRSN